MQKEIISIIEKSTETTMESARKVAELNQRTFEKLFQQQADLTAFYMDATTRSLELFGKAKGYQDLMAGQTALLRECGERCITVMRDGMAMANESVTEYSALAQEGFKAAQAEVARASSVAMKAAA